MNKRLLILGIFVLGIIPLSLKAAITISGTPTVSDITDSSATISVTTTGGGTPAAGDPTVSNFTPDKIPAGKGEADSNGIMVFKDTSVAFSITGTNLNGATLTSDNPDLTFNITNVATDGTTVTGNITSKATAKDGPITITIKNNGGKSVTQANNVTITGTQYLERAYPATTVEFHGDWSSVMPDPNVTELKDDLDQGLSLIKSGKYSTLDILPIIYTKDAYANSGCDVTSVGCADQSNNKIAIKDVVADKGNILYSPKSVLLHESAHKLTFYYLGYYHSASGVLSAPGNTFNSEWESAVGDVSQKTCSYLPLDGRFDWKGDATTQTERYIPHCGFIWAYGANYDTYEGYPAYYEDIATMVQFHLYIPYSFSQGDAPTDPRYTKKISLLNQYGFIQ